MIKTLAVLSGLTTAALLLLSTLILKPSQSFAADEASYKKWSVTGSGGWLTKEGDEEVYGGQLYELAVGYRFKPRWSWEIGLGHNPMLVEDDSQNGKYQEYTGETWTLRPAFEMFYHMADPDAQWDPFVSVFAGAQYSNKKLMDENWNALYGPGVGVAYNINDSWSARGQYKLALTGNGTVEVNNAILVGLTYRFGGSSEDQVGDTSGKKDEGIFDTSQTLKLQPIYFAFDSSKLSADSKAKLNQNADYLKQNPNKVATLEGHCDERGTNEYNIALGQRRANAAQDYLRSLGIPAQQLTTVSFGEENPADPGHNEAAWAKNRRVETVVPK